ncbi:hypothetical protein JX265_005379 [Neoarthrinium moseri]|uniref:DUF6603 domain-containing protein n=1 Tax=Neoarthrinium moseri TaxID=1658444 RepID=A0A9P9WNL8_9PEZI|nr:hypothetical protein JX265_005379 [Neoarthrinium moseri]
MPDTWCVDSHHVSVKVGDCAVHLLVKNSGKKNQEVWGAVLVDGGTSSLNPNLVSSKNAIESITAKLSKLYRLKQLNYETIVVSHWDEDHYGGLVDLIYKDALKAENDKKKLYEVMDYLMWKDEGGEKVPGTYFYCPNEKESHSSTGKTKTLNGLPARFRRNGIYIEVCTDADPDRSTGDWYPFAILKSAEDNLYDVLGVNFFENKGLKPPVGPLTPVQLVNSNPPGEAGWPGMYCIGVKNQTFKQPKSSGIPEIVPEGVTKTNQFSIAQVILWPDGTNPPKCSHYSAGDADEKRERLYMAWLYSQGVKRITNMKLSHHGSRSSSPQETPMFQPVNIVISNPTGSYFHPGWETIFFLAIYARYALENLDLPAPRMFATKYPFYFAVDKDKEFVNIGDSDSTKPTLSTKAFDDGKHGKILQEFIKEAYGKFLSWGGSTEMAVYNSATSPDAKRKQLMMLLLARWDNYCWPKADLYDNADGATPKPKVTKTTSKAAPESVMVRSSQNDALDGKIGYTRFSLDELFMYDRPKTITAPKSTDLIGKRSPPYDLNGDKTGKKLKVNWLDVPKKSLFNKNFRGAQLKDPTDEETDTDLTTQPISEEGAFFSQAGTNINEMDHEDWEVDDGDAKSKATDLTLPKTLSHHKLGSRQEEEGNLPAAPQGGLVDLDIDGWYIYASQATSDIQDTDIQRATIQYLRVNQVSPWDGFMATLHCAAIGLASNPLEDATSSSIELLGKDELRGWFQDALGAANALVLKSTDTAAAGIGGFALTVPIATLTPPSPTKNDEPTPLLFTTDSMALANSFPDSQPPAMGLRDGATSIILGLDVSAARNDTMTLTLETLASFVGLEDILTHNPLLSVLSGLRFVLPGPGHPGTGNRNAIWFVPQMAYATTLRLQLDLSKDDRETLESYLGVLQCTVTSAYLIARRKSTWISGIKDICVQTEGELVLVVDVVLAGLKFNAIMELCSEGVVVQLILNSKTGKVIDTMLQWLKTTIIKEEHQTNGNDPFPFKQWLSEKAGSLSFPSFDFRRLTLSFVPSSIDGSSLSFASFALDMELEFQAKDQVVISLITFNYSVAGGSGSSLEADLWLAPSYNVNDPALRLLPDFENYAWFEPLGRDAGHTWPSNLDLGKLVGFTSDDSPPSIFPTTVTMAKLYVNAEAIGVAGRLRIASDMHSKPPIFSIDQIDMAASYKFGSGTSSGDVEIALGLSALIQAPPTTDLEPAELRGAFHYDGSKKSWYLVGTIDNLYISHLYQFFHKDVQLSAASLLGSIGVKQFKVQYLYQSGQATHFELEGILAIGNLDFVLDYRNGGDPWDWDFHADVHFNEKTKGSTFGAMLTDIVGDIDLPGFLDDIKISLDSSEDRVGIRLVPNKEKKCIVFTLWVQLGGLRVQYIQYAYSKPGTSQTTPPTIKRVFLTSIKPFDSVDVPLLGKLSQPFDEAIAMWVQPQAGSDGLTKGEVKLVNDIIKKPPLSQEPLPYKTIKRATADTDTVLGNGVHLMITLKDNQGNVNVVVDYVLGGGYSKDPDASSASEDDSDPEGQDSGMVKYSKSYGGLSVRNLGLKYAKDTLTVKVDASVKFGPMEFAVSGFAIDLAFNPGKGFSLFNLPEPSVRLDGLAAVYDKSPIAVGGMLERIDDSMYQGALLASYKPWQFSAAGCYGEIKGLEQYKTFFVYARLLGPLITFEFATISGVTAGFGYNSSMRLPTVNTITDYPLISNPAPSTPDPQGIMRKLKENKQWFSPQQGSFWIAAGLDVVAFEMLDVSAVLAIQWDPNIKIGIFAIATADIPAKVAGKFAFAHVQLGMTAIIDVAAGTMKIDGQLTPSSYILHPDCHLTGGFALYTWFGDSVPELKGDWVFTLGGYHRQYKPPVQYPDPPRLGISWQFSSAISIRGEAYFAITPKVCMGGGRWDVSLQLGPLEAYYYAFIDFLINFAPFNFVADGGIAVGVRFTMDLWIVTIHISVDIGATIHIEGPPIHGTVHVDFWVFGFDIDFGGRGDRAEKLCLDDFIILACQASDGPGPSGLFHAITPETPVGHAAHRRVAGKVEEPEEDLRNPHVLVVQSGLVPDQQIQSQPSGGLWTVRAATFSFAVSCKIAISKATIVTGRPAATGATGGDDAEAEDEPSSEVLGTGNPINARPMCNANTLTTELHVRITPVAPARKQLMLGVEGDNDGETVWNKNKPIVKSLPAGLWGPYDCKKDPSYNTNNKDYLNGDTEATVSLMCGVIISVPDAAVSDKDKTFPFKYQTFMVQELDEKLYKFPKLEANEKAFLPADPGDKKKQWDQVRQAWENPKMGSDAPSQGVAIWESLGLSDLGWDPAKVNKKADEELTGQMPKSLVDDLEGYYLWAPFRGTVNATRRYQG